VCISILPPKVIPFVIVLFVAHGVTSVPSQKSIYEKMLAEDDNFSSTMIPKNRVARFLESGLRIQASQYVSVYHFHNNWLNQIFQAKAQKLDHKYQ
jgi:hypothetical protein